MISIINLGYGNVGSLKNMIEFLEFDCKITSEPDDIINSKKIILPGVGSFDYAMNELNKHPILKEKIIEHVFQKKIILGICLGMALMCKKSEEGVLDGLGFIDGEVIEFKKENYLKVPHIGWNKTKIKKNRSILKYLNYEERFYFAHSYYLNVKDKNYEMLSTTYGEEFTSGFSFENIHAVQFHPEKSNKSGMKFIKGFCEL